MMIADRRMVLATVLAVAGCIQGFGQSGSIIQDEHDKQIKLDTERNTKYHNNADDYPVNKPAAPVVAPARKAVPYLTSADIHDMYARADAARDAREAEFHNALRGAQNGNEADMLRVADDLLSGYGTTHNTKLAMSFYGAAARLGPSQAFRVGTLLSEGGGGKFVDNVEAYRAMKMAADGGSVPAKKWLETHSEPRQQSGQLPSMITFADDVFRSRAAGIAPTSPGKGDQILAELKKVYEEKYTNWKKGYKLKAEASRTAKATLYGLGVPADPNAAAALMVYGVSAEEKDDRDAPEYAAWTRWALFKQGGSKDASLLTFSGGGIRTMPNVDYLGALFNSVAGDAYAQRELLIDGVGMHYDGKHYVTGTPQMTTDLAVMMLEGQGGSVDEPRGLSMLQEAADKGSASARYIQGLIYERGLHGVPRDPARAAQLFQAAAAAGQTQAKEHLTKSASLTRP